MPGQSSTERSTSTININSGSWWPPRHIPAPWIGRPTCGLREAPAPPPKKNVRMDALNVQLRAPQRNNNPSSSSLVDFCHGNTSPNTLETVQPSAVSANPPISTPVCLERRTPVGTVVARCAAISRATSRKGSRCHAFPRSCRPSGTGQHHGGCRSLLTYRRAAESDHRPAADECGEHRIQGGWCPETSHDPGQTDPQSR